jgi:acyl dehydratase
MSTANPLIERRAIRPCEFVVTAEMNAAYLEAEEDHDPRYLVGRCGRSPIVHPGLLLNHGNSTKSPNVATGPNEAALHTKDEAFFLNPAFVGTRLRVEWTPGDRWEKRGRIYTVTVARMCDEDGREILRRNLISTRTAKEQPIGGGPAPTLPTPAAAEAAPARDPSGLLGLYLERRPKAATLSGCASSPAGRRRTSTPGCPAPIASTTQNMGHFCELLIDAFGEAWRASGTLVLAFIRPIYAGDTITNRAVVTEQAQEGDVTRYTLRLTAENQQGTVVTAGGATALWR